MLSQLRGAPLEGGAPLGPGTQLHMVAVTNPLTREAQRMSQVRGRGRGGGRWV